MRKTIFRTQFKDFVFPIFYQGVSIPTEKQYKVENLLNFGEVVYDGTSKARTWTYNTIFPSYYIQGAMVDSWTPPYDLLKIWEDLCIKNIRGQFIVEGTNYAINSFITKITPEEQNDGSLNIAMDFIEDKELSIYNVSQGKTEYISLNKQQGELSDVVKKHTIRDNEDLLDIAQLYYGDSSKYVDLMSKNNIVNKNQIYTGMELYI